MSHQANSGPVDPMLKKPALKTNQRHTEDGIGILEMQVCRGNTHLAVDSWQRDSGNFSDLSIPLCDPEAAEGNPSDFYWKMVHHKIRQQEIERTRKLYLEFHPKITDLSGIFSFLTEYTRRARKLQLLNVVFYCPEVDNSTQEHLVKCLVEKFEEIEEQLTNRDLMHIFAIDGPVPKRAEDSLWKVKLFKPEVVGYSV